MLWGIIAECLAMAVALFALFFLSRRLQTTIQNFGYLWLQDQQKATRLFFFLVAPGTVIHELAHTVMAIAMRVPVGKIELFNPQRDDAGDRYIMGSVSVGATDIFRALMIGTAPVWAAIGVFWGLLYLFGVSIPQFTPSPQPLDVIARSLQAFVNLFVQAGPLQGIVIFYLFFALGNSVLLSREDITELRPMAFIIGGLIFLMFVLSLFVDLSRVGILYQLAAYFAGALNIVLFLLLGVIFADIIVLVPLYGAYRIIYQRLYPD